MYEYKYRKYKDKYLSLKNKISVECPKLSGLLSDNSCGLCHGEKMEENEFHYADCDWKPAEPCNKDIENRGWGHPKNKRPNEVQCLGRMGCEWREVKDNVFDCRKPCTKVQKMNRNEGCRPN